MFILRFSQDEKKKSYFESNAIYLTSIDDNFKITDKYASSRLKLRSFLAFLASLLRCRIAWCTRTLIKSISVRSTLSWSSWNYSKKAFVKRKRDRATKKWRVTKRKMNLCVIYGWLKHLSRFYFAFFASLSSISIRFVCRRWFAVADCCHTVKFSILFRSARREKFFFALVYASRFSFLFLVYFHVVFSRFFFSISIRSILSPRRQYFRTLNTRVSVVYIETWGGANQAQIDGNKDITKAISNFNDYTTRNLLKIDKDTTQLLT